MIFCMYTKLDRAAFVPHLDILRCIGMATRRSGLRVQYSEGYNPHMLLFFNQPLPIGTNSECEYFCIHSPENANDFMQRINEVLPDGVKVSKSINLNADPSIAKIMNIAVYECKMSHILVDMDALNKILNNKEFYITYEAKGKQEKKEVRSLIYDYYIFGRSVYLKLACGNVNLRADRVMDNLLLQLGITDNYTITKKELYDKNGENIDKLFEV